MAIKKTLPPPEVMQLVVAGTENTSGLEAMADDTVSEDESPHRVYSLRLTDIVSGRGYQSVVQVGWRVFHRSEKEAAVEVYSDASGTMHQFAGVNRGPYVEGTRAAVAEAEELEELADDDFVLNVLRIPQLYTLALWLQHEDPEHDVILPVAPVAHGLEACRPYSWRAFLDELKEEAERILANEQPPEESPPESTPPQGSPSGSSPGLATS